MKEVECGSSHQHQERQSFRGKRLERGKDPKNSANLSTLRTEAKASYKRLDKHAFRISAYVFATGSVSGASSQYRRSRMD